MNKVCMKHKYISCLDLGLIFKLSQDYANAPKSSKIQYPEHFQSQAFQIRITYIRFLSFETVFVKTERLQL